MSVYLAIPFAFVLGYLIAYRRGRETVPPVQVHAWEGITPEEIRKLIADVEAAHIMKVGEEK